VSTVDVWRIWLDESEADVAWGLLAPDERLRAARLRFDHDAHRFAVCRAVTRSILGGYLDIPAAEVEFGYGPHGKPVLAGPLNAGLAFNISHSRGLALCAVTTAGEIGIDIEELRHVEDVERIARHVLSRSELDELTRACDPSAAFLAGWTRKEALVKAVGDGLAHAVQEFTVPLWNEGLPRIINLNGCVGSGLGWWLCDLRPATRFVGALAAQEVPSRLVWHEARTLGAKRHQPRMTVRLATAHVGQLRKRPSPGMS
jgi:4'-phosphopantetheinyl transferase